MNVFSEFHLKISALLTEMAQEKRLPADLDLRRFIVEPTKDCALGDLACNAAMVFARDVKEYFPNPRQFATALCFALAQDKDVQEAEVAGPGFINIRLDPKIFSRVLRAALEQGARFGAPDQPAPSTDAGVSKDLEKINIEYVSANPTGPMHVGHGRGAVFGDALANLLSFVGAQVTREYYINDAGAQVDVLARSAYLRYLEALGEPIGEIPEGLYPGDYLIPVGQDLAKQFGETLRNAPESDWLPKVRDFAISAMMDLIRKDLASVNIRHEVFFSERSLTQGEEGDQVALAIQALREKGLLYVGRLAPPKGKAPEDWEDREQTLFRSAQFGDDSDRALLKSDGGYTYFASDIAYHKTKIDRGFDALIDIWGADHGGYVKRMHAAVDALSDGRIRLDVKLCQLVALMRAGEPVKMGKRAGNFVTLRDVVDEVGCDAVRFMMLFRKNDAPLEFDLAKVIERSKDNPVFYVQYAYARGRSTLREAQKIFSDGELSPLALAKANLSLLTDEGELALIKAIAQYPRIISQSARAHEPHRIAFYLHDLASAFHAHYHRGKDNRQLRFINQEQRDLSYARLALAASLNGVLASGLGILGVHAPEEMR